MSIDPQADLWRILRRLDIGDCWEWTGALSQGYGRAGVGSLIDGTRRIVPTHRFVYEGLVGPVPSHLVFDHLCRNTRCANPDHLEPVTKAVNAIRGYQFYKERSHCKNGHPFSGPNLYISQNARRCRACHADSKRRRDALKAAA